MEPFPVLGQMQRVILTTLAKSDHGDFAVLSCDLLDVPDHPFEGMFIHIRDEDGLLHSRTLLLKEL
jgi:hypothetical protein